MPIPTERPSWVDGGLFPFRSRFVELSGHVVHYVDEGEGPVLLMVHGNPTWSFVWRQAIEELSSSFRCVAPDLPGFGLSTAARGYGFQPADHAAVVAEFVHQLDLDGVTPVVQDWGGPVALAALLRSPDRVRSLVIGNTFAWPVNGDFHFEAFSHLMGGVGGRFLIRHLNLFVNVMIPAGHRRRSLDPVEMGQYRRALPTPARRQASGIFPLAITGARQFLADLDRDLVTFEDLPALVVWADGDVAFRDEERRRWEARLSDHRTVILEGAGHYLQSDAPVEFAAAIRDWFPTTG